MNLLKPPPLRPGDTIGVIAPAGAVYGDLLAKGVRALEARGFRVLLAEGILARKGYLAGSERQRAETLERFFLRDDIAAIFCARGGFGSIQLLPALDAELIRTHPKIFVGFSDVTALLNWMSQSCGIVAFHGPMVAVEFAGELEGGVTSGFWDALTGKRRLWQVKGTGVLRGGNGPARGPLAGGCLSVLVTTLGTPYEIDTAGKIVFLEDVGERPYRIERMLTHLRMAGKLDGVAGVVTGAFNDCETGADRDVTEVLTEVFAGAPYPVVTGLPCGHATPNTLLPIGLDAELDGRNGVLMLVEPATQAAC